MWNVLSVMNVASLVKSLGRKKEFDFFSKVAYICDELGKDINDHGSGENKAYYYELPRGEHGEWNYFMHHLPENDVMIHEGSAFFDYHLTKKDYYFRFFDPVVPERWEKLVDKILNESK